MRAGALIGAAVLAAATPSWAQDAYAPPPVGALFTWSFTAEGATATRVSEVVAVGEDFAIFLADISLDDDAPFNYFAEFSGVHAVGCGEEMPPLDVRARLADLWPASPGKVVSFSQGPDVFIYSVEAPVNFSFAGMSEAMSAVRLEATRSGRNHDIVLSTQWGASVAIDWGEGVSDVALSVTKPAQPTEPPAALSQKLGRCSTLLQQ